MSVSAMKIRSKLLSWSSKASATHMIYVLVTGECYYFDDYTPTVIDTNTLQVLW
jgi:hypothetical protein